MRVLVCGGRDFGSSNFGESAFVFDYLEQFFSDKDRTSVIIISGCAQGVDTIAINWAHMNYVACFKFPADWPYLGKKAGYVRNKRMLEDGKPDLVIAFPGGKGTAMMVDLALKAGVEVIEVTYKKESQ